MEISDGNNGNNGNPLEIHWKSMEIMEIMEIMEFIQSPVGKYNVNGALALGFFKKCPLQA